MMIFDFDLKMDRLILFFFKNYIICLKWMCWFFIIWVKKKKKKFDNEKRFKLNEQIRCGMKKQEYDIIILKAINYHIYMSLLY